jgi:hypothetical protein
MYNTDDEKKHELNQKQLGELMQNGVHFPFVFSESMRIGTPGEKLLFSTLPLISSVLIKYFFCRGKAY